MLSPGASMVTPLLESQVLLSSFDMPVWETQLFPTGSAAASLRGDEVVHDEAKEVYVTLQLEVKRTPFLCNPLFPTPGVIRSMANQLVSLVLSERDLALRSRSRALR